MGSEMSTTLLDSNHYELDPVIGTKSDHNSENMNQDNLTKMLNKALEMMKTLDNNDPVFLKEFSEMNDINIDEEKFAMDDIFSNIFSELYVSLSVVFRYLYIMLCIQI